MRRFLSGEMDGSRGHGRGASPAGSSGTNSHRSSSGSGSSSNDSRARSNDTKPSARSPLAAAAAADSPPPPRVAPAQPGAFSSFPNMHLSSLFQRRQRTQSANHSTNGSPSQGHGGAAFEDTQQPPHYSRQTRRSAPALPPHAAHVYAQSAAGDHRRTSDAAGQPRRRRLSSIFGSRRSLMDLRRRSDRDGLQTPEEQLNPLITQIFSHPDHVEAFREALEDDAGQREPPVMSTIWPSVGGALGKLGVGAAQGVRSSADPGTEGAATAGAQSVVDEGSVPKHNGGKRSDSNGKGEAYANSALLASNTGKALAEPTMTMTKNPRKVGRIAAASDFAPVHERTQRRGRSHRRATDSGGREGTLYLLLRFPLLLSIFLTIALEFFAYVLIRQLVNLNEFLVAWRGHKGTLRNRLRRAMTAKEWREVALELDSYLGYETWKCEDASGLYDWILVKKVMHSLKMMRQEDDAEGIMNVLDLCLRNNFAGTENFRLYSETFLGTKYLIESYLAEVEEALRYLTETDKLPPQRKRAFYRAVQKNMGRSALCLSGGACFGYYHIGVVRALLDANLLPNIITGTSAGGLIAALACTRTNDELDHLLVPELADRITACEEGIATWGPRLYKTGARFDTVKWAEKCCFFTMGSLTFAEAYKRTGKVLNISVIPSDRHSPVKLLNHYTAPNCIIWSSLLASAAVPGIMNPVCLMQKTPSGDAIPWNWGHRFKDGSLRSDIPLQDLHSLFNVNYPIVSQANPHVHLFFFAPKGNPGRPVAHRKGKGWRGGFLLSASEHVLKLHLSMNFKIIRDLDLLPSILGQDWSSVFLQRFSGAVTIWPKTRAWDWVRILSDPDRKELKRMIRVGSSVTFPKLHMIENRVRLERAIQDGRKRNRKQLRSLQGASRQNHSSAQQAHGSDAAGADSRKDAADSQRSSGEFVSRQADGATMPSSADGLTQSDTDGGGEDFFAAKGYASSADGRRGTHSHPNSPKQLRRLQKQLAHGFSVVRVERGGAHSDQSRAAIYAGSDDGASFGGATTPSEYGELPGGASAGFLTPGQMTPADIDGRLPRHIRERSLGIDDDDEQYDVGAHSRLAEQIEQGGRNVGRSGRGHRDGITEQDFEAGHMAHAHPHHHRHAKGHSNAGARGSRLAPELRTRSSLSQDWMRRGSMRSDSDVEEDDEDDEEDGDGVGDDYDRDNTLRASVQTSQSAYHNDVLFPQQQRAEDDTAAKGSAPAASSAPMDLKLSVPALPSPGRGVSSSSSNSSSEDDEDK